MTIAELIEKLKEMPGDAVVLVRPYIYADDNSCPDGMAVNSKRTYHIEGRPVMISLESRSPLDRLYGNL